jgi:hypothetical protein
VPRVTDAVHGRHETIICPGHPAEPICDLREAKSHIDHHVLCDYAQE